MKRARVFEKSDALAFRENFCSHNEREKGAIMLLVEGLNMINAYIILSVALNLGIKAFIENKTKKNIK